KLDSTDGTRPHFARARRVASLHRGVVLLGRERRSVERLAAGGVEHDVAAPGIEHMPVWIREVHRYVGFDLPGLRLESIDSAVCLPEDRTPRRLDLRAMKDAFLQVERAARIEREAVDRVMRVCGIEAAEDPLLHVVLVVAVRVLEKDEVWRLRNEHAPVVELEARGVVEIAGKHGAFVRAAIAVGVLEDEQL